jgi:secreted trypsin-like serine protease
MKRNKKIIYSVGKIKIKENGRLMKRIISFVLRQVMLPLPLLFVLLAMLQLTHQQHYACRTTAPCGCSIKMSIVSRVVGGETVNKRAWGWVVSLTLRSTHGHFCGGSVLSSSWILTAAHCVSRLDAPQIIIHAGSNNLNESTQSRRVAKIVLHPNYDENFEAHDIALIQLTSPLDMDDRAIAKICLPPQTGKIIHINV